MEHVKLGSNTYARLWKITCKDESEFLLTDHDETIQYEGDAYLPCHSFQAFDIEKNTGVGADSAALATMLDVEFIREEEVLAGKFDGANVEHVLVNWQDLSENYQLFTGQISKARCFDSYFEFEFLSPLELLENATTTKSLMRRCQADLGDDLCKFNIEQPQFSFEVEVFEASGQEVEFVAPDEFTEDWFVYGQVKFVDEDGTPYSFLITSQTNAGDRIRLGLMAPIPKRLKTGVSICVRAGCDKCFSTCRTKFSNQLNFRGFPHLPRDEWLYSYPDPNKTYTGGKRFLRDALR